VAYLQTVRRRVVRDSRHGVAREASSSKNAGGPDDPSIRARYPSATAGCTRHRCASGDSRRIGRRKTSPPLDVQLFCVDCRETPRVGRAAAGLTAPSPSAPDRRVASPGPGRCAARRLRYVRICLARTAVSTAREKKVRSRVNVAPIRAKSMPHDSGHQPAPTQYCESDPVRFAYRNAHRIANVPIPSQSAVNASTRPRSPATVLSG
jgi:hypothetical protein